jgi:16S rRNA (adenine1518-N6/adenine1519-N6)-dimethyltransferase
MRQPHGQNFLIDNDISRRIVEAAGIIPNDKVIEIGPGKGALTSLIAGAAGQFKAIEVDFELFEGLNKRFPGPGGAEIIHSDFLKYPFSREQGPFKIISNLPYNVSTAIIEKILPEHNWESAVLMVQKEVGGLLTAEPGSKEYGSFTLLCRHYARFETLFSVGPKCFFPRPKVDSVVLKAVNLRASALAPGFIRFLRSSFSQRRKTILNNVSYALNIPKIHAVKTFEQLGISPLLRPENLSFGQFETLYKNLSILVG